MDGLRRAGVHDLDGELAVAGHHPAGRGGTQVADLRERRAVEEDILHVGRVIDVDVEIGVAGRVAARPRADGEIPGVGRARTGEGDGGIVAVGVAPAFALVLVKCESGAGLRPAVDIEIAGGRLGGVLHGRPHRDDGVAAHKERQFAERRIDGDGLAAAVAGVGPPMIPADAERIGQIDGAGARAGGIDRPGQQIVADEEVVVVQGGGVVVAVITEDSRGVHGFAGLGAVVGEGVKVG